MIKKALKGTLSDLGLDTGSINQRIGLWSIKSALEERGLGDLVGRLREIAPDISGQEETEDAEFNEYWETKRRALHAFQCSLMMKALRPAAGKEITVVDIGDSAGTHMTYLKKLTENRFKVNTLSVNLDAKAVEKIKKRGLEAVRCRAEDISIGERDVDLFTSFEMVEHLHDPAIFFRRLAKNTKGKKMLITVPYLRQSRVGLYYVRNGARRGKPSCAESEHIFELSPADWSLLLLHSGWKVAHGEVYYQYPRNWFCFSAALSVYWKSVDFEGFWGAILEKDTSISDLYRDWEG